MGLKLLLKMLGITTLVIVLLVATSLVVGTSITYLAILVPLGLFAFLIFKFGKEGVVAILFFVGILFIFIPILSDLLGYFIFAPILGYFLGFEPFWLYLIGIIIGVILIAIAFLLRKIWGVKIFKKKQTVSSESF